MNYGLFKEVESMLKKKYEKNTDIGITIEKGREKNYSMTDFHPNKHFEISMMYYPNQNNVEKEVDKISKWVRKKMDKKLNKRKYNNIDLGYALTPDISDDVKFIPENKHDIKGVYLAKKKILLSLKKLNIQE